MDERYCVYLRKSRADTEAEAFGEGETLARHRAALYALAKKLKMEISSEYSEIVSGETIAARPVMQRLLADIENGMWNGVFVMEIERLARGNSIDQGVIAQAFMTTGTKIITPLKIYDPKNEFDEEYFEFGLFMSRREFKTINRRIQRGRIASVKEGNYIASTAPYGYDRVKNPNQKGYTLAVNSREAEAVRLIYELYVNGESGVPLGSSIIARRLNERHYPTRSGMAWTPDSVRGILRNRTYTGKIIWGQRPEIKKIIEGKIVRSRTRHSSDAVIISEGTHEALITEELFDRAQTMMQKRIHTPVSSQKPLSNPLAGIVVCGMCGRSMTQIQNKAKGEAPFIRCPNMNCKNVSARTDIVEKKLLTALKNWVSGYTVEIDEKAADNAAGGLSVIKNAIREIDNDVLTIKKQLDSLSDLLEQGVYSAERYSERARKLSARLSECNADRAALTKQLHTRKQASDCTGTIVPHTEQLLFAYDTMNATEKNMLLKELLDVVYYKKASRGKKNHAEDAVMELIVYPRIPKKQ